MEKENECGSWLIQLSVDNSQWYICIF